MARQPRDKFEAGAVWLPRRNLKCSQDEHRPAMHRSVRSLSRGLSLIRQLNVTGPASAPQLAVSTGLNRTTCYRLLQTLQDEGYVSFDAKSAQFSLTNQIRTLSEGVSLNDLSSQAALPPMFALLREVSWPSDFAVFERGSVMIHESTHSFSPLSIHRSMIGRQRSLVRSALGRAILAAAAPTLRREMLEVTAFLVPEDATLARDRKSIGHFVSRTNRAGYASSIGETEPGISAIALPIQGIGPVLGSLNIVFFSSAMSPEVAARRYLRALKEAVRDIERRWR
ncbi:IclR family transcriptional regulator domain-containing protein, partial [Reyranella sp.]